MKCKRLPDVAICPLVGSHGPLAHVVLEVKPWAVGSQASFISKTSNDTQPGQPDNSQIAPQQLFHSHTLIHTYSYTHTYTLTVTHTYTYICIYTHILTYTHPHTLTHIHTQTPPQQAFSCFLFCPRLKAQAKDVIEALGSKEIKNMKFRSSWVFVSAKGFELPSEIEREKVSVFPHFFSDRALVCEGCPVNSHSHTALVSQAL